jgi:hypothetical protein
MRTSVMSQSEVIFYREDDTVWVREWLKTLPNKAQRKCLTYIVQLEMQGHELRRPVADFLRDGIYELRPSYQDVQYRILYFFSGKGVVVLSHGITKEGAVPGVEINRAIVRKKRFEADPKAHTYKPGRQKDG